MEAWGWLLFVEAVGVDGSGWRSLGLQSADIHSQRRKCCTPGLARSRQKPLPCLPNHTRLKYLQHHQLKVLPPPSGCQKPPPGDRSRLFCHLSPRGLCVSIGSLWGVCVCVCIYRERERVCVCVCVRAGVWCVCVCLLPLDMAKTVFGGPSTNGTEAEHGKTTICLPDPTP